ncbi:MAG: S8 family serine peptidase [Proteobacteria bacterium]|nr:S8 family serine peptidase [Pseudomonadota bacterium]
MWTRKLGISWGNYEKPHGDSTQSTSYFFYLFGTAIPMVAMLVGCYDAKPPPPHTYDEERMVTSEGAEYLAHEVIVKRASGVSETKFRGEIKKLDGRIVGEDSLLTTKLGFYRIQLPAEIVADEAISILKSSGVTTEAERNYIAEPVGIPNDPRIGDLWGMHKISTPSAWDLSTGSSEVLVAVSDTGVQLSHPDLATNMWVNEDEIPDNGIDDDGNGYVDDYHGWDFVNTDNNPIDDHGHGTHVSGTIGAVGNDGYGVVGVNWNVKIMALKAFSAAGRGYLTDCAESILYAADKQAKVLNASWGCKGCYTCYLENAIADFGESGGLFVAAAGNAASDADAEPYYPACHDVSNVVAVAATDRDDIKASFSNWGKTKIHLAAPGVEILSTFPGNSYKVWQGTSMAAPHVAGAAALYISYKDNVTPEQVRQRLISTCDPVDHLADKVVSNGRLNAYFVLAADSEAPDSPQDVAVRAGVRSDVEITWTPNEEEDVKWYKVAWSTVSGQYAQDMLVPSTEVRARIINLENNVVHYFVVTAIDEYGNYSDSSSEVFATPHDSTAPGQVVDLAVYPASGPLITGEVLTASSEASDFYRAPNIIDGSPDTSWTSMPNPELQEEYVAVGFTQRFIIDRVVLTPVRAYPEFFPIDFDIEVAGDSPNWVVVGGGRNVEITEDATYEIRFPAVEAMMVRIRIITPYLHESENYYTGLSEMSIYQISDNPDMLQLKFTAPGDDPGEGRSDSYDIRYSMSPLDEDNFEDAEQISGPQPTVAGVFEHLIVDDLQAETDYYFALKATDEAGNVSPMSNVASNSTLTIPPGPITDLSVTDTSPGAVGLAWTASGSDGYEGQATSYDLRHSDDPITASNFESAMPVEDLPVPGPTNTQETFTVTGLNIGELYYFAVKAIDDSGAAGGISNIVWANANGGPDTTPPATVHDLIALDSNIEEQVELEALDWSSEMAYYMDGTYAVDGKTTFWMSGYGPADEPEWLIVDMGEIKPVTRFRTHPPPWATYMGFYPQDFDIEVSADAIHWQTAVHVEGLIGEFDTWDDFRTPITYARYARLYTHLRGPAACDEPGGCVYPTYVIFSEFEAYAATPEFDVNVYWIAPGDDDWFGNAAAYDLRHSFEEITPVNFEQAEQLSIDLPQPAGMLEIASLLDLEWETAHYFALKTADEANNWSEMSNLATIMAPPIPPAPVSDLAAENPTIDSLTLTWTATGDDGHKGTATSYDIRYLSELITINNWDMALPIFDEPNPAPGGIQDSVVVDELEPSSHYYFAMKVIDDMGNESLLSNIAIGETADGVAPAAISDLSIATNTAEQGSINLSWTATGDDGLEGQAIEYDLRISTSLINADNFGSATRVSTPIPAFGGNPESTTISGLNPEAVYYAAIKVIDEADHSSDISNIASGSTRPESPAAIGNLAVIDADYGSLTLHWTATGDNGNQGTAVSYDLRYSTSPITSDNFSSAHSVSGMPEPAPTGTDESIEVDGLESTTVYYFAIKAIDDLSNTSPISNVAAGETLDSISPSAVSDLTVTTNSSQTGSLIIEWTATGDDENQGRASRYDIRVSTSIINVNNFNDADQMATPAPGEAGHSESIIVSGLNPEAHYYVAIKVIDDNDNQSDISNVATGDTREELPNAVDDLKITETSYDSATLRWTATGDNADQGTASAYELRYHTEPIDFANWNDATEASGLPAPSPPGAVETATVASLDDGTLYYFALKVIDDLSNESAVSNLASAETRDGTEPSSVNNLTATPVDPDDTLPLNPEIGESSGAYSPQNSAEMLLDGSDDTIWMSPAREEIETEYVRFDLGEINRLGRMRLVGAPGYLDLFPVDFIIQTRSTVDGEWQTVVSETEFSTTGDPEEWALGAVEALQVRLLVIKTTLWTGSHYTALAGVELFEDPTDYTTIRLTWSAPGDDDDQGTANQYDIRSAQEAITSDGQFTAAQGVNEAPSPQQAGSLERLEVRQLQPETTYCYALKSADEAGNISQLSNSPCATTPGLPPSTITDLQATDIDASNVTLTWNAPGADGTVGQASEYRLKMSSERINLSTWDSADDVPGLSAPKPVGSAETFTVGDLESLAKYFFALRAVDAAGNLGAISNNVTVNTADNVPPAAVADLVAQTNMSALGSLSVTWTAPGDNGSTGQADEYDLRVSHDQISLGNFYLSQRVSIDAPKMAGEAEGIVIEGLDSESQYYIALKTIDADGNVSALSNVADSRTEEETPADIDDLSIIATSGDEIGGATTTLSWTAPGDNGDQGVAATYDIRYSEALINESNFESAAIASDPPAPLSAGTSQEFTITDMELGTKYYFAIKTHDDRDNVSNISNVPSTTTDDLVPPSQVDDLAAETGPSPKTVSLSWTAPGDDAMQGNPKQYDLRYSLTPIDEDNFDDATKTLYQPTGGVGGTLVNFTAQGLPDEELVYLALKAADDAGNWSLVSNSPSARTMDVAPSRIANLSQVEATLDTVTVSWTAPGDDGQSGTASSYDLRVSTFNITESNFLDAAQVSTDPPAAAGASESAVIGDLGSNTVYYVAIKALDERGNRSTLSNVLSATTADDEPPGQITDLIADTGVASGMIDLNWIAPGDDGAVGRAHHYELKYSLDPINASNWQSATQISGLPTPKTAGLSESFTATNLTGETLFHFAIRAVDDEGNSGTISPDASAETPAIPPSSVSDLAGEADSASQVTLSWTAPGDDGSSGTAAEYDIRYSTNTINWHNFDSATQVSPVPDPETAGTSQSVTVSGLGESFTYYFAIIATDDKDAQSGLSNVISVTTLDETAPAAPGSVNVTVPDAIDGLIDPVSVEASSQLSISLAAENLIDGDEQSSWVSDGEETATEESLTVDLGETYTVDRIRLLPDEGYVNLFPHNFTISVSEDKNTWTDVLDLEEFEATSADWLTFAFEVNIARYIRVTSYDPASSFFGLHYTAISEIEIYESSAIGGQAHLAWVAPGDDGHIGTADHYEVYQHTAPFDESTLGSATLISGAPTPSPSGILQAQNISELLGETRYYWALRAVDESGNIGPLSEVVTLNTEDVPPSVITDLSAGDIGLYEATLSWTAPGDDGTEGQATSYEMRYAAWSITIESFPLATEVSGLPAPLPADEIQSFTVTGLEAGTMYRFAMLARDETGATSYLSNVVIVETEPEPDLVHPDAVTDLSAEVPQTGGQPIPGEAIEWSSQQAPDFVAEDITDGSYSTLWSSVASTSSDEEWVKIDLGSAIPVDKVRIWPADAFVDLFPPSVEIRTSPDGLNWSTVFNRSDYVAEAGVALEGTFPVVPVRYVIFAATELALSDNELYYAVVAEVEMITVESEPGTVVASWTATGDDADTGTAESYDLRIGSCPYDHEAASLVTTGDPRESGGTESFRIVDLAAGDYCLGLIVRDEAGNESDLSNEATVTVEIGDNDPIPLNDPTPMYPDSGTNWNYYVKNDGATAFDATDTACVGDEIGVAGCLHGGELLTVEVTDINDCTGLTAVDSIGAFNWICDNSTSPVSMISNGLRDGKGLTDLIECESGVWKSMRLTVSVDGAPYGETSSSAWWDNPIVIDNDGGNLSVAGTVYVVNDDVSANYKYTADNVGLVISPSVTLTIEDPNKDAVEAMSRKFLWFEGAIDADGCSFYQSGVYFTSVNFSQMRNVLVVNAYWGIALWNSENDRLVGLTTVNNNDGLITSFSSNNIIRNVTSFNNDENNVYIFNGTSNNTFTGVTSFGSDADGISFSTSTNNRLIDITASNNGNGISDQGIHIAFSSHNNLLVSAVAANNWGSGFHVDNSERNSFLNLASANNGITGAITAAYSFKNSAHNYFTGIVKAGKRPATKHCNAVDSTEPGLDMGPDGCATDGTSDSMITNNITLATSFKGKADGDAVNLHGATGTKPYDNITDWLNFSSIYRGWSLDGSAFPDQDQMGQCDTGETCRIWDWALDKDDTVVLAAISELPTGDDTMTQIWDVDTQEECGEIPGAIWAPNLCSLPGQKSQVMCEFWGGDWVSNKCSSLFLRDTVEVLGDFIGNENGLCESDETCLSTPNIGSYQGHGNLEVAGTIGEGATLERISLLQYATNGN